MNALMVVAAEEWRFWLRSRLIVGAMTLLAFLLCATSLLTIVRMEEERHARVHQQAQAEETFLSQPDRHPHRMVHYGHYVFRTPAPLSLFDPGLDPVTGQSIFLEGHRQNTPMFADSRASANLGGFSWLTPALIYQLFAPLIIILLGHSAIVREREASTLAPMLAQGLGAATLVAGKALAIMSIVGIMLVPILPSAIIAVSNGEGLIGGIALIVLYFLYLSVWTSITLFTSIVLRSRSAVLATLTGAWLTIALLLPALAVSTTSQQIPIAGKIETDLLMLEDLRKLGDGHNANDPAFAQLRTDLMQQYNVTKVEELPVNLRGIVAQFAEEKLTATLNAYAETRMQAEARQASAFAAFGWLSPALAVGIASRAVSGTDLATHHHFLRAAEQVRINFVQQLNKVHAEQLSYADDINRSRDVQAEQRTRVSADNWAVLDEFKFALQDPFTRISRALPTAFMLTVWLAAFVGLSVFSGRRIQP